MAVDARTKRLFVVNVDEDTVSVLDARSGALLHTVHVGQSPTAVAVDERTGRVFVVNSHTDPYRIPTERGSVSMLDARSGAALRTIPVGWDPTVAAVDERKGRIFVVNRNIDSRGRLIGNGSVSVLDARSGTVLRTIPVGVAPIDVAVVFDRSGSMAYSLNPKDGNSLRDPPAPKGKQRIDYLRTAVNGLLDKLPAGGEVALWSFSTGAAESTHSLPHPTTRKNL